MLCGGVDALRYFVAVYYFRALKIVALALRNLGACGCDVADDNTARMVAVKYRGLLGCFGRHGSW